MLELRSEKINGKREEGITVSWTKHSTLNSQDSRTGSN